MKNLLPALLLLILSSKVHAQKYFQFIYTNSPVVYGSNPYDISTVMGWLYTGKMVHAKCSNCTLPSQNAITRHPNMDSLHNEYFKIFPWGIFSKNYAPYVEKNVPDGSKTIYKLYTYYKVENNILTPIYQVRATFTADIHNEHHDVLDFEFAAASGLKTLDSKMVLKAYKAKLKEEENEAPPPMRGL